MRLYYSPFSPYARKCRIVLREKGALDKVEEVQVDPFKADAAFAAFSPMLQVPALVDDAGVAWTDSPLICARLDQMGPPRFLPEGDARWAVLRREVIADGAMEQGVKLRLESVRPEGERSATWMARWREGVLRSLGAAEAEAVDGMPLDLGAIATVCALTWLDFRMPELGWKATCAKLAALQETLEQRPSFRDTAPS